MHPSKHDPKSPMNTEPPSHDTESPAPYTIEQILSGIVMGLIVAGVISKLWMLPLMSLTFSLLDLLLSPLAALLS